ncbi:MAG: response regulator [Lentisphaeria bacterium]
MKILAIDDHSDNLTTLKVVLSDQLPEARLLTATNAPAGLELARNEDPDVILLNIVMPGLDSYAVCRILKDDAALRTIPVLFLTALKTDRDCRLKALEAGAEGFLSKPFDAIELAVQIRTMIKIKAAALMQRDENQRLADLVAERTQALQQSQRDLMGMLDNLKAENAARKESEARVRSLFKRVPIPLALATRQGRVTYVNDHFSKLFGYTLADIPTLEAWWPQAYPDEPYRRQVIRAWEEKMAQATRNAATIEPMEYEVTCKNGSVRVVEISGIIIGDSTLVTLLDLTERRRAEENYRTLFREMLDGFALHEIICNRDGTPEDYRFLAVNPAFERMTGLKAADCVGRTVRELLPQTEPHWIETYGNVALTGEPTVFENYSVALNKHFEVKAFRPAPGQFACIFADITERKQAEAELQKMQKLQSVGTLAGGIAHDFNNILMGVFGNISLAKDELAREHPGYKSLEDAEQSMNRAVRLTKQLLTFAKGGEPVKEDVVLGTLVTEVAQFDLSGSQVKLVCHHHTGLWPVKVDKGQIQQVVSNLTLNARQAMPDGGILSIALENAPVPADAVHGLPQGNYVKITLRDTGTGIDPKYLERIFDPYFTTKQTGSGLGLASVYSIIHRHGGHISVASELGHGTTFTFYLPASDSLPAAAAPPAATAPPPRPAKILVMDDEETVCRFVVKMLTRCGFSVATAPDGREAVALYQEAMAAGTPFDAVIMDLTVPGGMGGKEAIKDLLAVDPHVNAIVSSGYADDPVMANYADYGFKGIAAKPYTPGELRTVLARILKPEDALK